MAETDRLRLRFFAALVSSGVLASSVTACGGSTKTEGSGGSGGSSASGGSGGTASGGSAGSGGTAGAFQCAYGTPATQCFTLAELESQLNNPPQGGDVGLDAGPDAWITVTDCLPKEEVQDGCCTPASQGPEKQADTCCYVFCTGACCGRPFVVQGAARLPAVVARRDWLVEPGAAPDIDALTRGALAAAWLEDARMEHASIASFAELTLELMGFGAPPELVAGAHAAALDEIEHARLCFGLAARFGESPVGPGALDVAGAVPLRSLADAAVAAFEGGCIGETIAALTARRQLQVASDPDVRGALSRIAEDEERHAELGWRLVAWATQQGGAPVRRALAASLARVQSTPVRPVPHGVSGQLWQGFGRLSESDAAAIARGALSEVIEPCARALLDAPKAAHTPARHAST
jgi:hypothetical protein